MFIIPYISSQFVYNFIWRMRRQKKIRKDAYYRLLDTSLPVIETHKNNQNQRYSGNKTREHFHQSPEKYAERIIRSQQFVYIDLDDQNGCRPMEKSDVPAEDNEEVEKVGRNYIGNLKYLSERNQQTIEYLQRSKELEEQKQSIRKVVKQCMDKSLEKMKVRKMHRFDYNSLNKTKDLEYDPLKLRKMIEEEAIETMNQDIWAKEKKLIQKFGIISNYTSKNKNNQKSLIESRRVNSKKMQLPAIVYRTIQK